MKRLLAILFWTAVVTCADGQTVIGAGATIAHIKGYDPGYARVGYYITAEGTEKVNQYFALSASVQWINQRVDPISVNSIGVGLYAKALPFPGASVVAGIQNALITTMKLSGDDLKAGPYDGTISLAFGLGYLVDERIEVKTIYLKQITDDEIFTGTFQLGVNYKIRD